MATEQFRVLARGKITVTDAADVSRLVETYVRAIEASDVGVRRPLSRRTDRSAEKGLA
jgi:hypothetical protein